MNACYAMSQILDSFYHCLDLVKLLNYMSQQTNSKHALNKLEVNDYILAKSLCIHSVVFSSAFEKILLLKENQVFLTHLMASIVEGFSDDKYMINYLPILR